ncbi:hypothetical protein [Yaniella flava]
MHSSTSSADFEGPNSQSALPSMVEPKLRSLLSNGPSSTDLQHETAHTARGWLDLAHEAAYADDLERALECASHGLANVGTKAEVALGLYRLVASVHHKLDDEAAMLEAISNRTDLLRTLGQTHQADMEDQLGSILFAEADAFASTVLSGVADQERSSGGVDTVLADVLIGLAVHQMSQMNGEEALELIEEAAALQRRRADAGYHLSAGSLANTEMFLAHLKFMNEQVDAADTLSQQILETGCNRAVRAAMWMMQAVIAHHRNDMPDAASFGVRALELYARLQIRPGAASAASLVASVARRVDRHQLSVLAWKVAVDQAEQGEVEETSGLVAALGHQLLDAGEVTEAEEVLTTLVTREKLSGNHQILAHALIDLGNAVCRQGRYTDAVKHWRDSIDAFLKVDAVREAARTSLGAGMKLVEADDEKIFADAEELMRQAVEMAKASEDPAVETQGLRELAKLLCDQTKPEGLALYDKAIELAGNDEVRYVAAELTRQKAHAYQLFGKNNKAVATALTAADMFEDEAELAMGHGCELMAGKFLIEDSKWLEATTLFTTIAEAEGIQPELRRAALLGLSTALRGQGEHHDSERMKQQAQRIEVETPLPTEHEFSADTVFDD